MRNFMKKVQSHEALRGCAPCTRLTTICGILLLMLSCAALTMAQEEETNPRRGVYPGVSYDSSNFGSVNLSTGNVLLNIPLVSLPVGRGGLTMGVSLNYNSKLWDVTTNDVTDDVGDGSGAPRLVAREHILSQSPDGGWRLSAGYGLKLKQSEADPCLVNGYINSVEMVFPDGSAHEFRPYGYQSERDMFQIQSDGWIWDQSTLSNCQATPRLATTAPMSYYSTDATYLRLEFAHDSDQNSGNNPWTLYLPDGGRVTGTMTSNGATDYERVYDRNNNYVEIKFAGPDTGRTNVTITDQEARSIILEPANPLIDGATSYVTAKGFGGEDLRWAIHNKTIHVVKNYDGCSGTACVAGAQYSLYEYLNVVDQVILPAQSGGMTYTFGYNARDYVAGNNTLSYGWGELSSVTLPSGGQANYQYTYDGVDGILSNYAQHRNYPTKKTVTYQLEYDGTSTPVTDTWLYAITPTDGKVTGPDGGANRDYHYGMSDSLRYRRDLVYKSERPDGSLVENVWQPNTPAGTSPYEVGDPRMEMNPVLKTEYTSIPDSSGTNLVKTAIKDYSYDKNGNVTQVKEYDWVAYSSIPRDVNGYPTGVPAGAPLKRVTTNSYYSDTPDSANTTTDDADSYYRPTAPPLRTAVKSTEVGNGSQTLSRTEFFYSSTTTTGNLTKQTSWDSQKGAYSNPLTTTNSISVAHQYDAYGNRTLTTDPRGYQAKLVYGPVGGFSGLYPTESYSAFGTTVQRKTTQLYDLYTGLVTSATDVDNNVTTSTDYDVFGRPTLVTAAVGKPEETRTATSYDDAARRIVVHKDLTAAGDGKLVSVQHFDQLGRVRLTRQLEDAATESETDETDGLKVQTRYRYSGGTNSYQLVSNPYRAATSNAAGAETTMGWTRTKADKAGRVVEVRSYSGTGLPAPWGTNATTTGAVVSAYDANVTTVTDQASKDRQSTADALGRIVQVTEDPGTGGLGYVTTYAYDALNNLTTATQATQTRTFSYSSLSRLTSATNPESGALSYAYDNNGNLAQKTDARSIVTTYTYDALNRPTLKNYSDATPDVAYFYDAQTLPTGAPSFVRGSSEGRLVAVTTGGTNAGAYYGYDALGRVVRRTQRTDSINYLADATYNKAGAMITETYPAVPGATDRRTISYSFDGTGRLSSLTSAATTYAGAASVSSIQYAAHGGLSKETFGNNLVHALTYNARLQPTQIKLGTATVPTSVLSLTYNYGTTANNGNVVDATNKVGTWTAKQIYTYDALNRLDATSETNGSTTTYWTEDNGYDRYGNRWVINGGVASLTFNSQNRVVGYTYDAAGNVTNDTTGLLYTYDAENRIKTVAGVANTYVYDGEDLRIKKYFPQGDQLRFVYGVGKQLIMEFDTATGQLEKEYVYGTSGLLATIDSTSGTQYLASDHLGSPRVATSSAGAVVARHDYMPFGRELLVGEGGRTAALFYGANDGLRQKFTQKERDIETGLDFFEARYYSSAQGRFSSPDPYNIIFEKEKGQDERERRKFFLNYIAQPQVWNKYTYSLNNPLKYTDPDGRRAINDDDQRRLNILNQEALAAREAGNIERAEAFEDAITYLAAAIDAAPDDPSQDPANLKAAFWALDHVGSTEYSQASTHDNGVTVPFAANSDKCNIFVAESYAFGAGVGFGGSGVPTRASWKHSDTAGNVYDANSLANPAQEVPNFSRTGGLPVGTLVAFENPYGSGHVGVTVGGTVIVHAASDRVKADGISELRDRLTHQYRGHVPSSFYRVYKP